jgi:hypothetical protein
MTEAVLEIAPSQRQVNPPTGGEKHGPAAPTNIYGLKGNYVISPAMKKAARAFGLQITHQKGSGDYEIKSQHGSAALMGLVAPFLKQPTEIVNHSVMIDRAALRSLLEFLHQPLHATAIAQTDSLELRKSEAKSVTKDQRRLLHHALRFATTGSPAIPIYQDPELAGKESAECHADAENQMKDDSLWALEMEIANAANLSGGDNITSAIPGSYYDPARGFVLKLHERFLRPQHGAGQAALQAKFWALINQVTNDRYTSDRPAEVALSAMELQNFCATFCRDNAVRTVMPVVEHAIFEDKVQTAMEAIAEDAQSLLGNISFQQSIAAKQLDEAQDKKLQNLLAATTALTPVITSAAMRGLWSRHKLVEKIMGMQNPVEVVATEVSVMQTVLSDFASRGHVTPAEMQAVTNRFAHVITMGQDIAEALEKTAHDLQRREAKKQARGKVAAPDQYSALTAVFASVKDEFAGAAPVGTTHIEERFLNPEYAMTLDLLKKGLNQGGNFLMQTRDGAADTLLEWAGDLVSSSTENPGKFVLFACVAAYLFSISSGANAQQVANTVTMAFGDSTYQIPPEAVASLEKAADAMYAAAGEQRGYHYDFLGPFIKWKHFVSDNLVAGWTKTLLGSLPLGHGFMQGVKHSAETLADGFFVLNFIQNFAPHAAFYIAVTEKGLKHGFKNGFKHILKLSAPILDVAAHGAVSAAELVHLKKNPRYDRGLLMPGSHAQKLSYKAAHGANALLSSAMIERTKEVAKAAHEMVALETEAARERREASLSLKVGWQEKDFLINGEIVTPLMQALREFDVTLQYIASKIGIDEDWHHQDLQARMRDALAAVEQYRKTGDTDILQKNLADNLSQLIGAQMRHTGQSPIYSAIFNEASGGERNLATLERFHSAWVGRESRKHSVEENRQKCAEVAQSDSWWINKQIDLAWKHLGRGTTKVWDKCVRSARTVHEVYHLTPYKKQALMTTAAACAAGLIYDAVGPRDLIGSPAVDDIINGTMQGLSGATGAASAAVLATTIALAYNFVEDTLGIHVVGGSMFLATGAGVHHGNRSLIAPIYNTISEKFSAFKSNMKYDPPPPSGLGDYHAFMYL